MLKAIRMTAKRTVKKFKVIICHNCTFYNISAERHVNDTYEVVHRFTNIVASVLPHNEALICIFPHIMIVNDRMQFHDKESVMHF